jgi:transposase
VAYRKGHRYLLIVTCHATGRVVWAHPGRNQDTLRAFFDTLGQQRATALTHVSCDGAEWIHDVITERAPQAVICLDPFHAVQWATDAIDEIRRRIVRDLKAAGRDGDATALKGSRWALLKNPDALTGTQAATLASIKTTNDPLYRAYLMKEQLRDTFTHKGTRGRRLLLGVISWASHSRIPEMVALARTLRRFQDLIETVVQLLGKPRPEGEARVDEPRALPSRRQSRPTLRSVPRGAGTPPPRRPPRAGCRG